MPNEPNKDVSNKDESNKDESNNNEPNKDEPNNNEPNKEDETVKEDIESTVNNPNTGIITISVVLVLVMAFIIGYPIFKKKNYFSKI